MKCKAAKCICLVQLTQCAMSKYACTTRDDTDLYNNKMAIGEQLIPFFVSLSFVLSRSFSHAHTSEQKSFYFFQTPNWQIHTFIPVILVVRIFMQKKKKKHLQKNICRRK